MGVADRQSQQLLVLNQIVGRRQALRPLDERLHLSRSGLTSKCLRLEVAVAEQVGYARVGLDFTGRPTRFHSAGHVTVSQI